MFFHQNSVLIVLYFITFCTKKSPLATSKSRPPSGTERQSERAWKRERKTTFRVVLAAKKITSGWAKAARPREPKDRASERESESVKPHFGLCSPPTKLLRVEQKPPALGNRKTERASVKARMKKEKNLNASTWEKAKPASSSGWMAGRARKVQRVRESKQVILLRRVTCDCFELSGCAWERERKRERRKEI